MTTSTQVHFELLATRLKEWLPGASSHASGQLDAQAVEDMLREEGTTLTWSWTPIESLSDLVRVWALPPDELLLFAHLARGELWSGPASHPPGELFDGGDLLVLSRQTRFLGVFDAQYKHACALVPKRYPNPLHFYSVTHEFGEFSNFALYPVRLDGQMWPTTEHYFQAQKFAGSPHEKIIREARSPMEAARMGRERTRPLRRDWESVKIDVMRRALRAKFTQHPELAKLLCATHPVRLVEHTDHDAFWGDGGDGKGQNWLGRLLVELRTSLREELSR